MDHEHSPRPDIGPVERTQSGMGWQVWRYIHDHDLPYNALHNQDYSSIGCTHCTRAVRPGEDSRAGRWPGFNKTECGLHIIEPVPTSPVGASKAAKLGN